MKNKNMSNEINGIFDIANILGLPSSLMFFAFRKMKGIIMEKFIFKDFKKEDVFDYLISDRIFIDSLSDKEIKKYKKYFVLLNRLRFRNKILRFLSLKK